METTGDVEFGSLLDKIQPPRLEDAGLEDCALPPDSIQEAFLKAAGAVRSRIFPATSDDESEGECVNDPWPENGSSGDKLVRVTTEADPSDNYVPRKGGELPAVHGDEVVVGDREGMPDKVVEPEVPDEAEKSCVDGLQGLKIGEKKVDGEVKSEKSESYEDGEEEDEKSLRLTMAKVIEKFFITSMLMWVVPIAILYAFNNNLFPGSADMSPYSLTLLSGFLAVISVNIVIALYIYMAMKEPSEKHEPDPKFVSEAEASVKHLVPNRKPESSSTLKKEE